MTVAWPTTSEFLACLPDGFRGALAGAAVEHGMFDQPVVVSGQRAIVLPVDLAGERRAVRFSLADPTANLPRYEVVNQALSTDPGLPLLHITWEPAGIEIRGRLHPVSIMDWVDARTLADVVDDLVEAGDLDALAALTARLSGAFHRLEAAGIVHGDLQHANIMVDESAVTLVDYDSVFTAGLPSGMDTAESGHPSYRHPDAADLPGGRPGGDTFAATLIVASLNWIAARPDLWRYHHGENLILDASDLENLDTSQVWREINSIDHATARAHAERIRTLVAMDPRSLPSISDALALEDADATRLPEYTRLPDASGDAAVASATTVERDRPTIPTAHGDKPTLGGPTAPGTVSIPPPPPVPSSASQPAARLPTSSAPPPMAASHVGEPTPDMTPPGLVPVYESAAGTEMRAVPPVEQHPRSGTHTRRAQMIVAATIGFVLLVTAGAAGAWFAFGSTAATGGPPPREIDADIDARGTGTDEALGADDPKSPASTDDTDGTGDTSPGADDPTTSSRPPTTGHEQCDVITSTLALQWLESPPACLDYRASGPLPTSTIPEGWFIALASAVMTDPGAAATSQTQLERYRALFPDAVRVDSRLYRGMRDPVWAIVLPVSSESDALGYCSYPELADVDGCTARHTELTLDELQAGMRP